MTDEAEAHLRARLEYARQVCEHDLVVMSALREYGVLCLKWSFLLNAGAIAAIAAYIGARGNAEIPPGIIPATWPWAVGAACVIAAGFAAYLNFSFFSAHLPSPESLMNYMANPKETWPTGKHQKKDENPEDFRKRMSSKIDWMQYISIFFGIGSVMFFLYGIWRIGRLF